jgi:hypothetical protein
MGRSGRHAVLSTVALATLALAAAPLRAGTLNVPGDSPTIQGAIVMAADGDTILVAPGTYVETIDLLGKQLVIEGTGGAAVTTIDGNGGGSTVSVHTGEPAGTAIRGFTITGGTGQPVAIPAFGSGDPEFHPGAGGVHVGSSAHLELTDCVITGNSVAGTNAWGGGVYLSGGTLEMSGCTLSANTAESGTAIATLGYPHTLTASKCTLTGNTAIGGGIGSAIFSWEGHGSFTDCEITDNTGSGIQLVGYQMHFSDCVVRGNTGWGMSSYGDGGPDVIGCAFLGNGLGGALCFGGKYGGSSDLVKNCIFAGGDGLDLSQNPWADIANCTFDDTTITATGTETTIKNSIGRGTTAIVGYTSLDVSYSDVVGFGAGTGDIDADPLWVDAGNNDYHLLAASPCIDAGDPSSPLDPDGTRADMGAIPFENAFDDLGGGVAGTAGPVVLTAHSTLLGGEGVVFALSGTAPFQSTLLILGASQLGAPFKGGTLWPNPSALIGLMTNGSGQLTLSTIWPAAIPSGFSLWAQFWHADAGAVAGFAGSNGVRGIVP